MQPERVLDRFDVVGLLARGGMGEVWLALDADDHAVVLKTVRSDRADDAETCAAFRAEIAVTALLRHQHVVRHVDHGIWHGQEVLALGYIDGVGLDLLARSSAPVDATLAVACDLASALSYLHALTDADGVPLELVHGDLSPRNVLIDVTGSAHLIDFGTVAVRCHRRPTRIVGTRGYVSPEQARGEMLSNGSDQYSLGILLWEMLTGRTLFLDERARGQTPVPPMPKYLNVPAALEATIVRMLACDAGSRFASLAHAGDALGAIAAQHTDGRPWLGRRAHQLVRIHRGPDLCSRTRTAVLRRSA